MHIMSKLIQTLHDFGKLRISQWKRVGIVLTAAILALMVFMMFVPTTVEGPVVVEASCAAIPDATMFLQRANDPTEELTIILALPDGTPLVGLCVTFTRDLGPGTPPEIIGSCTSDAEGRCTVQSPGGEIHVHFGNTRIGGFPFDDSQWANNAYLFDATSGGVAFYFEGDRPAINYLVATLNESFITMGHAVVGADGSLVLLTGDGGDGIPIPDNPGGGTSDPEPPSGIVSVEFHPAILRTAQNFDRTYCYYAIQGQSYVRTPISTGTFLPGYGSYFDVGAVLTESTPPAFILDVDANDTFGVTFQCWGWQGSVLSEIGVTSATHEPEDWDGRELVIGNGDFTLTYTLRWLPADSEPTDPRLTDDNHSNTRFNDRISIPANVRIENGQVLWSYNAETPIGGFRIYRNQYLVGSVGANARGWAGDGLTIRECGNPTQFHVTSFLGGQESFPSSPASLSALTCEAIVTVTFDEIQFTNLQDCDGAACGTASEVYGYFSVNDNIIPFGQTTSPQFLGIQNNRTYRLATLLDVFDISTSVSVAIDDLTPVTIEIVLFDHDASTSDDMLCSWQTMLNPRKGGEWRQQDGTTLRGQSTRNPEDESDCTFSVFLDIQ